MPPEWRLLDLADDAGLEPRELPDYLRRRIAQPQAPGGFHTETVKRPDLASLKDFHSC